MIAIRSDHNVSPEDYLERERHNPSKHEYFDGDIYAMAGTSKAHNTISLNLALLLRTGLKESPCQTFMADIKVNVANQRYYFYPDLVVTCDGEDDLNAYEIKLPKVIIEVLSESTESFDRGKKFQCYRMIPSLTDYILVSSQDYLVEVFHRLQDDRWVLETYEGLAAIVELKSLDLMLPLSEIYSTLVFNDVDASEFDVGSST